MKINRAHILVFVMVLATILPLVSLARGGGGRGGGGGGGGGGSRGGGGGSMRSSPSVSRPSASRPSSSRASHSSGSASRSSSSSASRTSHSAPSASRAATPYSQPGYNYSGAASRPSTASRASMPVTIPAGSTRVGDSRSVTRPESRVQAPVTIPASRTSVGERPGARQSVGDARQVGSGITTVPSSRQVTTTGPRRSVPLNADRPDNYGSISRPAAMAGLAAAGVATGAGVAAARSGDNVDRGTGPRGGDYVAIDGPRGEFGAIRGPGGGEAVVGRGPGGEVGGAVRGPRGNTAVGTLPADANRVYWGGHDYYCHGHYWYAPYWYRDNWYYEYRYPPVNYWYETLPPSNETVVVGDETYYYSDAVYYQPGEQNGAAGYVVVPPPATNSAGQALAVLQSTCDFLGAVTSLTAEVDVTMERHLETGDKVPVSGQRRIRFRQPDHMAVDATGEEQDQRIVYNGKMITMDDRLNKRSIGVGAPPRIEDMLPELSKQYGKPMPFGDLLQRDAFDTLSLGLRQADYVGVRDVNGVSCHHVAFTLDDLDWELWSKTGDQPFPMKIVITYRMSPGNPRYSWECTEWAVNQPMPDSVFAENAPKD